MLKPYIWRDFESLPPKLEISKLIKARVTDVADIYKASIDYVHLRPEHVLPINSMCERHFWNGIDVSECLQYPDYTIVALYKKLIVGFAFMVPLTSQDKSQQQQQPPNRSLIDPNVRREMYLSFIFVHSDWREPKRRTGNVRVRTEDEPTTASDNLNVSIGQYMLYYLIKVFLC